MTMKAWNSLHIFYNSDPHWLLTDCLQPLMTSVIDNGLLSDYFFIRYWENGPHIRLRFRPTDGTLPSDLTTRIVDHISAYLKYRPSMFKVPSKYMHSTFEKQFVAEYGEVELYRKYRQDGRIPYCANNSVSSTPYVPEHTRYGGPDGVVLAERYFTTSSHFALVQLAGSNGSDFGVVLGHSFRLFLYWCLVFFSIPEAIEFSRAYYKAWLTASHVVENSFEAGISRKFDRQKRLLTKALAFCMSVVKSPEGTSLDHRWVNFLLSLKKELDLLDFSAADRETAERLLIVGRYRYLLPSYIHMHNNRLGLAVSDEPYVAYLASRLLEEVECDAA